MYHTRSRARPKGGYWKSSVVPMRTSPDGSTSQLQFRMTNGHNAFDPSHHEHFYTCPYPGGFKLQSGQMRPFRQATDAPFMLVADLDGTMVENNNNEAESAMWEFCRYWEENAVLRGGVLVYNTGRSLGQFTHLYADKGGRLALPDVLITAVGTKVCVFGGVLGSVFWCFGVWLDVVGCVFVYVWMCVSGSSHVNTNNIHTNNTHRYSHWTQHMIIAAIIMATTGGRTLTGQCCSTTSGTSTECEVWGGA